MTLTLSAQNYDNLWNESEQQTPRLVDPDAGCKKSFMPKLLGKGYNLDFALCPGYSLGIFYYQYRQDVQIQWQQGNYPAVFFWVMLCGTINLVTKQPLLDPFYRLEATVGNYAFYSGLIDLSGPLDDSKSSLYRLNIGYENSGSFIDFLDKQSLSISPIFSFKLGDRTTLSL